MSEENQKPLRTLDERIRDLEDTLEEVCRQLQAVTKASYLTTARYLGGQLPVPQGIAGKVVDYTIPSGFVVVCKPGPDVGKTSLIIGNGKLPPPNGKSR